MDIAIVGDKDFTIGFRLSGIKKVYLIEDPEGKDFQQKFDQSFNTEDNGIVIVDEQYFKKLPSRIKRKIEKTVSPVVIPLSAETTGGEDLRRMIKRSIGVDLWKE